MVQPFRRLVVGMVAVAGLAALVGSAGGCASAADAAASGPTVADLSLGGAYAVSGLRAGGTDQPVAGPVNVVIDARYGAFTLDTACGELLGAFTLRPGGRAGVTLAGGSEGTCPPGTRSLHDEVVAMLGQVSTWTQDGTRLVLATAGGDQVTLTRR